MPRGRPLAVFLSYRLGGADGVAVEAAKWDWALTELGFRTRRVAGRIDGIPRPDDVELPFLAIESSASAVDAAPLAAAIADADIVVVENIGSLPLNLGAATIVRDVLGTYDGRVLYHHHDFAWERPNLEHLKGFPPHRPDALHVTISEHARSALHDRGMEAVTLPNFFDFDDFDGDRERTRAHMRFTSDDLVFLQPTRAIPRKNVAGGLHFANVLTCRMPARASHYWITGPAEDGFDTDLARILADAPMPVHVGRAARSADAYAAADLVVFPSTWEGFGNPLVESAAARRMIATSWYPALEEITSGMHVLSIEEPDAAEEWLRASGSEQADRLEHNYCVARRRYSIEHLPERLREALATVGWIDW